MNGFYQAKDKHLRTELDLLTLDDIEFVSEEGEVTVPEARELRAIKTSPYVVTECPRCEHVQRNVVKGAYCTECGWDSVTDPCLESLELGGKV